MRKGKQFSEEEKRELQELVLKYKRLIENKQTDAVSLQKKQAAWDKVAMEFNANSENNQVNITIKYI
ncbi:hypothetical protein C0J52_06849 [Blattella germanica]|nr:hypothetical protein C0J52_06849 [Blattella germanica]